MTDTNAPAVINASELTLLVSDRPDARAYQANPIDLSDPIEARETLAALRADQSTVVLIGIEFDDPTEPGNRVVLAGDDLGAVRFVDDVGTDLGTGHALTNVGSIASAVLHSSTEPTDSVLGRTAR